MTATSGTGRLFDGTRVGIGTGGRPRAGVEGEGLGTDLAYVLVHDVPDAGWGRQGRVITRVDFESLLPVDPETPETA